MSKKVLSLVLALVMVLGTFGTAFAAATTPTGNEKVDKLIELGLVKGYADGTYGLAQAITRAEMATMVVRALDLEAVANASAAFPSQFTDMNSANVLWARGFVNVAAGQGIVNGYPNGTFVPANNVTYAEAAAMLVRVLGGLTAAEQAVAVWPTTYLAKAAQLGIFAQVDGIVDYNAPATRENLFEMVFNTLMSGTDLLIANTVEGIVVENYRTETLAKDEIVVHVMKDQDAKNDKYDVEKGEEFKIVVTPELAEKGVDVETLLGKVVKVSYDKNDKVVGVEQLAGYTYVSGTIDSITSKEIEVNGKDYTVSKSESRDAADERLYQVYLNNDDVEYEDLFTRTVLNAEYANMTVKNGKVLFIDAMQFEDIAPVAKEADSKDKVSFYDDADGGDIDTITIDEDAYVIVFEDGEMKLGNYEDIAVNDVMHWFKDAKDNLTVIVRPADDNKVEGEYEEAYAAKAKAAADINIVVDGKEYPADINTDNRNPVYSTVSKELLFSTLTDDYAIELEGFEEEEVVVLLDMFGKVQLIGSETIDAGFYAIITNQYNYDFELVTTDNTKAWYETDRATKLTGNVVDDLPTKERKLNAFELKDLVKVTAKDDYVETLDRKTEVGTQVYDFTKNVISFGGTHYYISKNAVVFDVDRETPKAMTVAEFLKNYNVGIVDEDATTPEYYEVEAYVVEGALNVAEVIVITASEAKSESTDLVAKFVKSSFTGGKYWLHVTNSAGEASKHEATEEIAKSVYAVKDKIVELTLSKDDAKKAKAIAGIEYEDEDVKVINYGQVSRTERFIVLEGNKTIWLDVDADVFGSYRVGSYVSYRLSDEGYNIADVLVVTSGPSTSTPTEEANGTLVAIYERTNTLLIKEGTVETLYEYAGDVADLSRLVGREINFETATDVNSNTYVYNVTRF